MALGAGACGGSGGGSAADATPTTPGPVAQAEVEVEDPALRAELLAMLELDQAARTGAGADLDQVDATNQARITEIFDEHGWPGWSLVGDDSSTAAWAIVQHADLAPDLQRRGLDLLTAAVAAGDASPGDLAYLVDRVRVANGELQVYGTL